MAKKNEKDDPLAVLDIQPSVQEFDGKIDIPAPTNAGAPQTARQAEAESKRRQQAAPSDEDDFEPRRHPSSSLKEVAVGIGSIQLSKIPDKKDEKKEDGKKEKKEGEWEGGVPPPASRTQTLQNIAKKAEAERKEMLNVPKMACRMGTLTAIIFGTLLLVAAWPTAPKTFLYQIPELAQLCRSKAHQDQALFANTFMFTLVDALANDTRYLVYVNVQDNVQVTNVMQSGLILSTEMIDFDAKQVVVYQEGRPNYGPFGNCRQFDLTNELSWMDIACLDMERISVDKRQMLTGSSVVPIQLHKDFFRFPSACTYNLNSFEDVTSQKDGIFLAPAINFLKKPETVNLMQFFLEDTLGLLSHEYGSLYIQEPRLTSRLAESFDLLSFDFLNHSLAMFMTQHDPVQIFEERNQTCCGDDEYCQRTIQYGQGLLQLCQEYERCNYVHPKATKICSLWDERPCECDYHLAVQLMTPGHTNCPNCLDDPAGCDCLVMAWLLKQLSTQLRPCMCSGQCTRPTFQYACGPYEKQCSRGLFSENCEVIVHYCPRLFGFPCERCHAPAGSYLFCPIS
jgi:hypothetical protein